MREKTLRTSLVSLPLALSFGLLAACQEDSSSPLVDAAPDPAATEDAAADAAVQPDAESMAADAARPVDASQVEPDGALEGDAEADAMGPPALGPYDLDCAHLPSNGTCQGGPREVLLVTEDHGLIAMFDPVDGHFLGYLKRPAASYYKDNVSEYMQATQGPDQCIWTVSEHDDAQVQRWNTDGSYRDAPLMAHLFPSSSPGGDPAIQDPIAIAFNADRLFVASQDGDPFPRLTRWKLDGSFDGVVLDDGSEARSVLPLNDGSLLISDANQQRVSRLMPGSQQAQLVLGGLAVPGQLWYAGNNKLLVSDTSSGTPLHQVDLTTGLASTVMPNIGYITNKYGIAALKNGKWLIAGGDFLVSTVDPLSSPAGKLEALWDDPAVDSVTFHNIGRACLPSALVEARAPKPPQDTCIAPPSGSVIFEESFEGSGTFEGTGTARHYKSFYDRGAPGVTSSIDATGGNQGSRALRIAGAGVVAMAGGRTRNHKTGVFTALPAAQPKYVRYRVKAGSDYDYWLGYVALQNAAANADQYERLAGTYFYKGYLNSLSANTSSYPDALDARWLLVELRNIDWSSRTYDLYYDCKRMAEGIALPAGLGDTMDLLDLYNIDSTVTAETVAWFDDILIK